MDNLTSISTDIGTLVPAIDAVLNAEFNGDPIGQDLASAIDKVHAKVTEPQEEAAEEVVEEVDEDVEENLDENSTQEILDVDNEVKPDDKPDALGEALARLSAQETLNKTLQSDLDKAKVQLSAPTFIPYDDLPAEVQREFDVIAEKAGIDPRVIVYNHFQRIVAEHEQRANSVETQREVATRQACQEVDKFFDEHPMKARHGKGLMDSLKGNPAWNALGPVAKSNPDAFKVAAVALLDAGFRKAEADHAMRQRNEKQQRQLKASTRGEASRATSAPSQPKPNQGEINAATMAEFMKATSSPLGSFFK